MRKVTEYVCGAFGDRRPAAKGNTSTDGERLLLHGNRIAEWRGHSVWVSCAGYPTKTTIDRLNGVCAIADCSYRVSREGGAPMLYRVERDGTRTLQGAMGAYGWACVCGPDHGTIHAV